MNQRRRKSKTLKNKLRTRSFLPQEIKLKEIVAKTEVVLNNMSIKLDTASTIANHMNSQTTKSIIDSCNTVVARFTSMLNIKVAILSLENRFKR